MGGGAEEKSLDSVNFLTNPANNLTFLCTHFDNNSSVSVAQDR